MRKISNKRLSRNLKIKKSPLRVLPLATFQTRHRVKQTLKKQRKQEISAASFSSEAVRCPIEKVNRETWRGINKSGGKAPLTIKPFLNFHFTMSALRWILLLIIIYLAAGTAVVMIQDGTESLKNIVIYSIMGFFTFFMGYLGWILARDVLVIVSGRRNTRNELEVET
ncbi:MAG: hypothetical protein JW840_06885 [Candidatus Thermoplasmatota archaeon]|nr:hypothetical protein [Candidatus Thermoplasmatota archaeon]